MNYYVTKDERLDWIYYGYDKKELWSDRVAYSLEEAIQHQEEVVETEQEMLRELKNFLTNKSK